MISSFVNKGWGGVPAAMFLGLGVMSGCASSNLRAGDTGQVASALAHRGGVEEGPRNQQGKALAFLELASSSGASVMAADLRDGHVLWNQPGSVISKIMVGRDVLVHLAPEREQGGKGRPMLLARELATGDVRWLAPLASGGEKLVGCDLGDALVCVARSGDELRGGEAVVWAIDLANGSTRWQRTLPFARVAGPAVSGNLVAVPNRSQFVTLLDGKNGEELAQVLSRETAAEFVRAERDGLYYGHTTDGAFSLSADSALGTRKSPGYLHATLPSFVRPVYGPDMYRPESFSYSAIDRNRILWRGETGKDGRSHFRDGLVTVLNYRFFFGFEAASGELRWAYSQPDNEAVSAADTGKSLVYVTVDGELGALDRASGKRTAKHRLPLPAGALVRGVTFDAEGFSGTDAVAESPPLADVLSTMLWDKDRRFPDLKVFVVDQLSHLPGPQATSELLRVLSGADKLPPAAVQRASEALTTRKDAESADLLVAALSERADVIDGKKRPPLLVLAKAVAAAGAVKAIPALVAHLRRPETEPAEVVQIARAAVTLGAREAVPALEDYVALYRADPEGERFPAPLQAASEAILALGGPSGAEFLRFVAAEPKTDDALRSHVLRALSSEGAAKPTPTAGTLQSERTSAGSP